MPVRHHSEKRHLLLFGVVALLLVVAMLGLSHWQWGRAQSKKQLLALALQQREISPLAVTAVVADQLPIFRRVQIQGHWLADHPLFLENQVLDGRVGYHVLMPFQPQGDTRALLVDRGWLPKTFGLAPTWVEKNSNPVVVELEVASRPPERALLKQGQTVQGVSFTAVQQEWKVKLHPLLWHEQSAPDNGLVRQWPEVGADAINKHLSYAGQWLLFAVMTLGAYGFYVWKNWRRQS